MGAELLAKQSKRGMSYIVAAVDSHCIASGVEVAIAQSIKGTGAECKGQNSLL
jgi:hypothetical protein